MNDELLKKIIDQLGGLTEQLSSFRVETGGRLSVLEAHQKKVTERLSALESGQKATIDRLAALEAGQNEFRQETREKFAWLTTSHTEFKQETTENFAVLGARLKIVEANQTEFKAHFVLLGKKLDHITGQVVENSEQITSMKHTLESHGDQIDLIALRQFKQDAQLKKVVKKAQ
ncbi:MAG: hypothetical protein LKI80_12545 [Sporolactobacillus sp.]|nr:hypothetical protein [Sporolactobacillus sp.]